MKLCAVVVWFNPDEDNVKNILSYSAFVEKIIIVDNSSFSNEFMLERFNNIVYIPLLDNLGIAKALNVGCDKALEYGFEWCMTMDQDSVWQEDQLEKYIKLVENNISEKNVSFAPNLILPKGGTSILGDIKRAFLHKEFVYIAYLTEHPNKVIASGNIINLNVYKKVHGFNEALFIDQVDFEFCYKLKNAGYEITFFKDVGLNHLLGVPKKTLFPISDTHKGVRLFYMFRNMLYIKYNFPDFWKSEGYQKHFYSIIKDNLIRFKIKNLWFINKGIKAAKNNIYGRYNGK